MYTIHTINGYTVITIKHNDSNPGQIHLKDSIYITATIMSGHNYETKENAGIHHLLEHVLTEAWKPCGNDCSSFWDKKGVHTNASTHESYVYFFVNGLKKDMKLMTDYMTDIMTRPFFKQKNLEIEKHAVLNELLILKNDPESKLYDAFNKEFYVNGLRYINDYDLQIENLKKMNLETLRDFFKQIHQEIIFVSNVEVFPNKEKTLKTLKKEIFSYSTKIIYVPFKQKSTILMMAMPIQLKKYYKMGAALSILHMILFQELRVKLKMVYGITIALNLNPTYIFIKSTVEHKHALTVYEKIISSFKKYTKENFPKDYIQGMKDKMRLEYQNTHQNSLFLVNHILQEYKREGIISYEKKISEIEKIKDFRSYMVEFKGLVGYQGPVKIF
jgi:predicted Zn-dependent peptidase